MRERDFLRTLINLIPDSIYVKDTQCRYVMLNAAALKLVGVETLEEGVGRTAYDVFEPEMAHVFEGEDRRVFESGLPVLDEERTILTKSGESRWLLISKVPLRNEQGEITGLVGISRNITSQKVAQESLRVANARLHAAQVISRFGTWELELNNLEDLDSNPLHWSDEAFRIFGFEPGAVSVSNSLFFSLAHPEDRAAIQAAVRRALETAGRYSLDHRIVLRDGTLRYVHEDGCIFTDPTTGRPLRILGTIHDITERKAVEEAIRASAERFRLIAEHLPQVIFLADKTNGRFLYISPSFDRVYGRAPDDLSVNPLRMLDWIHPEDRERMEGVIKSCPEQAIDFEYRVLRPDKAIRHLHGRCIPIWQKSGTTKLAVALVDDVTDRKQLEEQVLRSQRLESIGTLAAGFAHYLNNILVPIMLSAGILEHELGDPEQQQLIREMQDSAERGAAIIRKVLAFSRGAATARRPLDPKNVLHSVLKLLRESLPRAIEIQTDIQPNLWSILGDDTQLEQVFMNLCVNSSDAMGGMGRLTLQARNIDLDATLDEPDSEAKSGPHILITVTDTGCGIPRENQGRIFEPFFTTKDLATHTGLGLSTCHAIVRSHGGFTRVQSELSRGSTFQVYLPATPNAVLENVRVEAQTPPPGGGETILVIDDEDAVRRTICRILERNGYRTLSAINGAEGVAIFARREPPIDIVVTDMMMPVMDGPATIKALKTLDPHVRIIACSGFTDNTAVAQATNFGVRHFLTKPFTGKAILQALDDLLTSPEPLPPPG